MKSVAKGDRTWWQIVITDPIVGLLLGCLILVFRLLPLGLARALGRQMGGFVGHLIGHRNQIGLVNLQLAFPDKSLAERQEILHQMWCHFGQVLAEIPHAKQVMEQAKITGLQYLKKAYRQGRGGFVCSAHLGNWELPLTTQVAKDFCLNPVFRVANNWMINLILFHRRQGIQIPKGPHGARLMLEVLKQGKFISILCDQKFREGMIVPLFGMPAQTATAMAGLSLKLNLPILMVRSIYHESDHCYHVEILPPMKRPQKMDRLQGEYQILLQMNQTYEQWFCENPDQWLWIHRRFDKNFYRSLGIK